MTKDKGSQVADTDAYAKLVLENEELKARNNLLERNGKKRKKRPPNRYQTMWSAEYKPEVTRAKSEEATTATVFMDTVLIPYSRQYGDTMNTSPHPKDGEALMPIDRQTFMKNVAIRAKAMQRAEAADTQELAPVAAEQKLAPVDAE
jgi:hypothetical protein